MTDKLVKSAARAIEVLRIFVAARKRMSAAQIGSTLGYPRSSLDVLLKSLVAQGYLSFHPGEMSYFPTLKVTELGDWLPSILGGSKRLLDELGALRDRTGETVTLTMPSGLEMRIMHALVGTGPIALYIDVNTPYDLAGTAVGTAFLSTLSDGVLKQTLARLVAARSKKKDPLDIDVALAEIESARQLGYAAAFDRVLPDVGAIAMPLVSSHSPETFVVAVGALSSRLRSDQARIIAELARTARRMSDPHGSE